MRFFFLFCVLLVTACASALPPPPPREAANTPREAELRCLSKGFIRDTFDFDSCYRNQPEVEASDREWRLSGPIPIIKKNRSEFVMAGFSYPLE